MMSTLVATLLALAAQQIPAEHEAARKRLQPAPGLEVALWAHEPLLANPVAIDFDARGRCYVAECWRRHTSTLDIHMRKEWLDDDLACRKHEDLVAYHRRRLGEMAELWRKESERIRIVEDRDGDGRADHASTFSEGYRELGEGIGAGVLVRGRDAYYTCIPNLWKLTDADGDGVAESRKVLFRGFGVHLGASGHDMHGLRFGPDGKLYWSHGDRGFRVEAEGKVFDYADTGGVLRCNPDGTELEVVCSGLRNPQELAFNELGDLFTGDNNISIAPDVGETCRWTHVVEGADFGWKIGYQFMPRGGAWCAEEQWRMEAGFQVPFVARLGHGPSGVTFYPGTGLSKRWDGHFLMCDYPGGIYAFRMVPKGASYAMEGLTKFLWDLSAPDVEFGPDGAVYVADWVGKWDKTDQGRIWRLVDPEGQKDPIVAEVKAMIAEGMAARTPEALTGLLAHRDQRIRQEAQFELASRKATAALAAGAAKERPLLPRLHALWGLGQVYRATRGDEALKPVLAALADGDAEVRAQAYRVLGDCRVAPPRVAAGLLDEAPRVRYFAAMSVHRTAIASAAPDVIRLIRENAERDRMIHHAGVMALAGIGETAITAAIRDGSEPVTMAVLAAMRKLRDPAIGAFLGEGHSPRVQLEAARAIYDVPIEPAMGVLAKLLERPGSPERALIRAVHAARRLGAAALLASFAADPAAPTSARAEAFGALASWAAPMGRDPLTGVWRPAPAREAAEALPLVEKAAFAILARRSDAGAEAALRAARALGSVQVIGALWGIVEDGGAPSGARIEALRGLVELKDARVPDLLLKLVSDADPALAREALLRLPASGVADAAERLGAKAQEAASPLPLRQAALSALGGMKGASVDAMIAGMLDRARDGAWPASLDLELQEAVERRPALKDRWAALNRPGTLEGGDAAEGRRIYAERGDTQCVRCHKVNGEGGEVGPDLSKIGGLKPPDYLLESLLQPNRQIAQGFGQTAFQMASDAVEVGRIESETGEEVRLVLADGVRKTLRKPEIRARKEALSAMPEDAVKRLSKRELRDLMAYLRSLK
jgi:quinoprotein glucose dehydrogenase